MLPLQAFALASAPTRAARAGRVALGAATAVLVAWLVADVWVQARFGSHLASYLPFVLSALQDREHAQWVGDPVALAFALARLLAATALACALLRIACGALVRAGSARLAPTSLRRAAIAATALHTAAVAGGFAAQRLVTPNELRQRLSLALPYSLDAGPAGAAAEGDAFQLLGLVPWPWRSADSVEVMIRNPAPRERSLDGFAIANERGQHAALAGPIGAGATRTIELPRAAFDLSKHADAVTLLDPAGRIEDDARYRDEDVKRGAALWFPPPSGASEQALRRLGDSARASWSRLRERVVAARPATLVPAAHARPDAPNVVLLILESFRGDVVAPTLLARLDALGTRGLRARRHYASSNSSHRGLFALLYGRHPLVYDDVLDGGAPPSAVELFRQLGHRTALVSSGEIEAWKRMDQFLGAPPFDEVQLHVAQHPPLWKEWPDCDRRTLAAIRALLDRPGPHFVVGFLMTTHFPYPYPPAFERYMPVSQEDELASWSQLFAAPLDRERLWNRYRNAATALESELVDFVASLDPARNVIAITGDHGESFGEDGALVHGSRASEAQTRVPLLLIGPGVEATSIDTPTSHVDVLPTLLHLATGVPDPVRGLDGRDLLGATPPRGDVLLAPYKLTQPHDLVWIHGDRRVLFRVRTDRAELDAFAFLDDAGAVLASPDPRVLLESDQLAAGIDGELTRLAGEEASVSLRRGAD